MKLLVRYNDCPDVDLHRTLNVTTRGAAMWQRTTASDIILKFVQSYNCIIKHKCTFQLDENDLHLEIADVPEPYDDKSESIHEKDELVNDESMDQYPKFTKLSPDFRMCECHFPNLPIHTTVTAASYVYIFVRHNNERVVATSQSEQSICIPVQKSQHSSSELPTMLKMSQPIKSLSVHSIENEAISRKSATSGLTTTTWKSCASSEASTTKMSASGATTNTLPTTIALCARYGCMNEFTYTSGGKTVGPCRYHGSHPIFLGSGVMYWACCPDKTAKSFHELTTIVGCRYEPYCTCDENEFLRQLALHNYETNAVEQSESDGNEVVYSTIPRNTITEVKPVRKNTDTTSSSQMKTDEQIQAENVENFSLNFSLSSYDKKVLPKNSFAEESTKTMKNTMEETPGTCTTVSPEKTRSIDVDSACDKSRKGLANEPTKGRQDVIKLSLSDSNNSHGHIKLEKVMNKNTTSKDVGIEMNHSGIDTQKELSTQMSEESKETASDDKKTVSTDGFVKNAIASLELARKEKATLSIAKHNEYKQKFCGRYRNSPVPIGEQNGIEYCTPTGSQDSRNNPNPTEKLESSSIIEQQHTTTVPKNENLEIKKKVSPRANNNGALPHANSFPFHQQSLHMQLYSKIVTDLTQSGSEGMSISSSQHVPFDCESLQPISKTAENIHVVPSSVRDDMATNRNQTTTRMSSMIGDIRQSASYQAFEAKTDTQAQSITPKSRKNNGRHRRGLGKQRANGFRGKLDQSEHPTDESCQSRALMGRNQKKNNHHYSNHNTATAFPEVLEQNMTALSFTTKDDRNVVALAAQWLAKADSNTGQQTYAGSETENTPVWNTMKNIHKNSSGKSNTINKGSIDSIVANSNTISTNGPVGRNVVTSNQYNKVETGLNERHFGSHSTSLSETSFDDYDDSIPCSSTKDDDVLNWSEGPSASSGCDGPHRSVSSLHRFGVGGRVAGVSGSAAATLKDARQRIVDWLAMHKKKHQEDEEQQSLNRAAGATTGIDDNNSSGSKKKLFGLDAEEFFSNINFNLYEEIKKRTQATTGTPEEDGESSCTNCHPTTASGAFPNEETMNGIWNDFENALKNLGLDRISLPNDITKQAHAYMSNKEAIRAQMCGIDLGYNARSCIPEDISNHSCIPDDLAPISSTFSNDNNNNICSFHNNTNNCSTGNNYTADGTFRSRSMNNTQALAEMLSESDDLISDGFSEDDLGTTFDESCVKSIEDDIDNIHSDDCPVEDDMQSYDVNQSNTESRQGYNTVSIPNGQGINVDQREDTGSSTVVMGQNKSVPRDTAMTSGGSTTTHAMMEQILRVENCSSTYSSTNSIGNSIVNDISDNDNDNGSSNNSLNKYTFFRPKDDEYIQDGNTADDIRKLLIAKNDRPITTTNIDPKRARQQLRIAKLKEQRQRQSQNGNVPTTTTTMPARNNDSSNNNNNNKDQTTQEENHQQNHQQKPEQQQEQQQQQQSGFISQFPSLKAYHDVTSIFIDTMLRDAGVVVIDKQQQQQQQQQQQAASMGATSTHTNRTLGIKPTATSTTTTSSTVHDASTTTHSYYTNKSKKTYNTSSSYGGSTTNSSSKYRSRTNSLISSISNIQLTRSQNGTNNLTVYTGRNNNNVSRDDDDDDDCNGDKDTDATTNMNTNYIGQRKNQKFSLFGGIATINFQ